MEKIKTIKSTIKRLLIIFRKGPKNNSQNSICIGKAIKYLGKSSTFRPIQIGMQRSSINTFYEWKTAKGYLYINPDGSSNPHIIISGTSGKGKSTLLKSIIIDLNSIGKNAILFDLSNEHYDVIRTVNPESGDNWLKFNLFSLEGLSVEERISELVSLFKEIYSLGYIQANELTECMKYLYRKFGAVSLYQRHMDKLPTLRDFMNEINIFIRNSHSASERSTLYHMLNKISVLDERLFSEKYTGIPFMSKGIKSLPVSQFRNPESRYVFMHEMLERIYHNMKSSEITHRLNTYIIIDEAEFIVNEYKTESNVIKRLIREGRKYGVGLIIATHRSIDLPKDVIENASTFIAFGSEEPLEAAYSASVLLKGDFQAKESIVKALRALSSNECVIKYAQAECPVIVKTKSYYDLASYKTNQPDNRSLDRMLIKPVKENALIKQGVSVQDINAALKSKELESIEISSNGEPETWLMNPKSSLSIEHEAHVALIKESFERSGIKCYIMDNSKGPDVVAFFSGNRIAVEYETGRKNPVATSKMLEGRSKAYDAVVVLVNPKYYNFYKSAMERNNVIVLSA